MVTRGHRVGVRDGGHHVSCLGSTDWVSLRSSPANAADRAGSRSHRRRVRVAVPHDTAPLALVHDLRRVRHRRYRDVGDRILARRLQLVRATSRPGVRHRRIRRSHRQPLPPAACRRLDSGAWLAWCLPCARAHRCRGWSAGTCKMDAGTPGGHREGANIRERCLGLGGTALSSVLDSGHRPLLQRSRRIHDVTRRCSPIAVSRARLRWRICLAAAARRLPLRVGCWIVFALRFYCTRRIFSRAQIRSLLARWPPRYWIEWVATDVTPYLFSRHFRASIAFPPLRLDVERDGRRRGHWSDHDGKGI